MKIGDEEGLLDHCAVAALIFNELEMNPATRHNFHEAITQATIKSSPRPGAKTKETAQFISVEAQNRMQRGDDSDLVGEHIVPVSIISKKVRDLGKLEKLTNKFYV